MSTWPDLARDPRSEAVRQIRDEMSDRVEFYMWLQWCLDEQLADAQRTALEAGMPIGIVHDLAVGVHPEGAETWTLADVLARDVTVGAPPDAFNQQGQDWSQPPWRPDRLAELGYAPFRDMIRTVLRHAGGLRVDHVIGLFRLWWVPSGLSAAEGTYVTLRPRGDDRHPRAGGAPQRRLRRRRGPRHGRALGPRLPARPRHARDVDPVVRARLGQRAAAAAASSGASCAWPR